MGVFVFIPGVCPGGGGLFVLTGAGAWRLFSGAKVIGLL